jgi:CRISPR-associated protein Csd1
MILQTLADYYERKTTDPDASLAPPGFEMKSIPFVIVIDGNGRFVALDDTRTAQGKKLVARSFVVPIGVKKTSGVAANLLWDTAEYVLGIDTRGNPERVAEQHQAFVDRLTALGSADPAVEAVLAFLADDPQRQIAGLPLAEEIRSTNPLITFRLRGETELVCQRQAIVRLLNAQDGGDATSVCLVSGRREAVERLHTAIKGVRDAQSSGANIVSFNLAAVCSYGKTQGDNAPVGKTAAFAYTTALNHLLRRDSRQRFQLGDATAVVWAARQTPLETAMPQLFSDAPKDDPDAHTEALRSLFASIRNGAYYHDDGQTPFHVLGLAPNNARIAVRFWHTGTVADFAERIARYFVDLDIAGRERYGHPSLFRLLLASAAQHKADNINPLLAGAVVRAVLEDLALPHALLQSVIRRIRAERRVTYERAALVKACLNRNIRRRSIDLKELTVALDNTNNAPGYRLGRLFAVLERLQEAANPALNATIRDRYYSAASSAPVTVFANLMRLSTHHLGKLAGGQRTYYEKLLGEVMEAVQGFPAHLPIEQQGLFAVGYYHQRQALFQKKDSKSAEPEPQAAA